MTRKFATIASFSALLAGLMMVPVAQAAEAGRAEMVSGELVRVVGAADACGAKAAPATDRVALAAAKIAAEVRLARLASELQGFETITLPGELEADRAAGPVADALRDEQLVFNAHREMLASKLAAFAEDKAVKQTELELNRQKQALFDRQIALAQAQLDRINTLRDKGLAISSQTIALEQGLLQLDVANDDLKLSVLHAQQSVNQVDRTVAEMRAEYRNEMLAEVNKTQTALAKLIRQSAAPAPPEPRASADCDASGASLFVVVRAANGVLQAIPVAPAGGASRPRSFTLRKRAKRREYFAAVVENVTKSALKGSSFPRADEMGRFETTAQTYAARREPYPQAFFAAVADALKLQGRETLIDLGTGPGLLALGFAPYVGRVYGVDPNRR